MRMLIFFDLLTETPKERRIYNKFRKLLISEGFIMMQESVYTKLALNNSIVNSVKEKIYKDKPSKGIVQLLVITEKQFSDIECITGENSSNTVNTVERLLII